MLKPKKIRRVNSNVERRLSKTIRKKFRELKNKRKIHKIIKGKSSKIKIKDVIKKKIEAKVDSIRDNRKERLTIKSKDKKWKNKKYENASEIPILRSKRAEVSPRKRKTVVSTVGAKRAQRTLKRINKREDARPVKREDLHVKKK